MRSLLLAAVAMTIVFSACTKKTNENNTDTVNTADQAFAGKAGSLYLANKELGTLAYINSSDPAIVGLAEKVSKTSDVAYYDLIEMARVKGLSVLNTTDAEHKAIKESLSQLTGTAFDSAYVHIVLQDQHNLLAEFNALEANGNNLTLRNHARRFTDTIQRYHDQADTLADLY